MLDICVIKVKSDLINIDNRIFQISLTELGKHTVNQGRGGD